MDQDYALKLQTDHGRRVWLWLGALNRTQELLGGELPIETFLRNAVQLAGRQIESEKLGIYLQKLHDRSS
jgi:hypothetical protein